MAAIPGFGLHRQPRAGTGPQLLVDRYKRTFDYLYNFEPMSYIGMSIHSQFGGRPLMIAAFNELLDYFAAFPYVWFASHRDISRAMSSTASSTTHRLFPAGPCANDF